MSIRPLEASFVASAPTIQQAIPARLSEVVFLGRSNVGKSSLINALVDRKNLAKSSSTPGKTQLINFFDTRWRYNEEDFEVGFVDLPGFGYAKVSKTLKKEWERNLLDFLTKRMSIRLFILLRDARHPESEIDHLAESLIDSILKGDQKKYIVFTKIDKLNRKEKDALTRQYPGALTISAQTKTNIPLLRENILTSVLGHD